MSGPGLQVCFVLPAQGVQRILKYAQYFLNQEVSHILYAVCLLQHQQAGLFCEGPALRFSTDHTLPCCLYWSLLPVGTAFWAPSDN